MEDEVVQLRRRHAEIEADLGRVLATATAGTAVLVVQTVAVANYPTVAGRMFGVKAVTITCAEDEGAAPSLTPAADVFYALHLGSTAPPVGTLAVATQIDGGWQFQT